MSYGGPQNPGYGGYQQPGYGGYPPQGGYGYGGAPARSYAGVGKRFVAHLLDGLVGFVGAIPGFILIFLGILTAGAGSSGGSDAASGFGVLLVLFAYLLLFVGVFGVWLYNVYLLGRDGASLGKRWMGIKVIDPSGQPLGFGKAFLRELVKMVVGNICGLLLLWPLWDQEKQGLYDKLFSTHVYDA
ncbi:MAG TPA: RDD family protein [Blastocatellia bacterium]|nr:RDD family protein [Blastocatellia bacterium]